MKFKMIFHESFIMKYEQIFSSGVPYSFVIIDKKETYYLLNTTRSIFSDFMKTIKELS